MGKPTPGPWEWNAKDQLVAVTVLGEPYFDDAEKGEPVVIIETDSGHYPPHGADRLLLAAAPKLLAELRTVAFHLRRGDFKNNETLRQQAIDSIEKAIDAATIAELPPELRNYSGR